MRIAPICSKEIIGRYRKINNTITDVFTNQILLRSNSNRTLNKKYNQLNAIGLLNAQRIDNKQTKLLYVLI